MTSEANALEVAGSQMVEKFGKKPIFLWGGVAFLVVLSAAVYAFSTRKTEVDQKAKEALFLVKKTYIEEMKPLLPPEEKVDPTKKDVSKNEPKKPALPSPEFKKLDVDATFSKTVKGYLDIAEQFKSKPAAFEAIFALGDLYYNHGQVEKALVQYDRAVTAAKTKVEQFAIGYSRAMALENLQKTDEAIAAYEGLTKVADETQAKESRLAAARLWLKKDLAKAKTLLMDLEKADPNSEVSKQARTYRLLAL